MSVHIQDDVRGLFSVVQLIDSGMSSLIIFNMAFKNWSVFPFFHAMLI